ncbi:hypothetical protein KIN20_012105 [Parelaphostrongylus tenuis]|uniref:Uncharacterized protein n=1 Tax=Parelaphostrongylus tenuis TaxID=148309 RepID=A0AAD5MT31_PARTN|nr:hypothetical protein KIN20_012105 [Parelaphostrongylus tenuis]
MGLMEFLEKKELQVYLACQDHQGKRFLGLKDHLEPQDSLEKMAYLAYLVSRVTLVNQDIPEHLV